MPTRSGTTYRRDDKQGVGVESGVETLARSSSLSSLDTDSPAGVDDKMHPNSPLVDTLDGGPSMSQRMTRPSYSDVVDGASGHSIRIDPVALDVDDDSRPQSVAGSDESDFSTPRSVARVLTSSPPRLDTKPKYFGGWFEEDSSSENNRYTFRHSPKQRWSDYSEDDDDLGEIPRGWVKGDPEPRSQPEAVHTSVDSSLFERALEGMSDSVRNRVLDRIEFVRKAEAGGRYEVHTRVRRCTQTGFN
ncbi:hypothetical protein K439DRAFT_1049688 [Ramaria rubella]|nr:hypothetical protein K439DRAFT_1049688 [Ramaria rubella]